MIISDLEYYVTTLFNKNYLTSGKLGLAKQITEEASIWGSYFCIDKGFISVFPEIRTPLVHYDCGLINKISNDDQLLQ